MLMPKPCSGDFNYQYQRQTVFFFELWRNLWYTSKFWILCNALKVTNANNIMCYLSKTLFLQAVNVIPYGIYGGGSMGGSMSWKKSINVPSIDIGCQRILAIRVCNSNTSRKVVHIAGSLPFIYNKLKKSIGIS